MEHFTVRARRGVPPTARALVPVDLGGGAGGGSEAPPAGAAAAGGQRLANGLQWDPHTGKWLAAHTTRQRVHAHARRHKPVQTRESRLHEPLLLVRSARALP